MTATKTFFAFTRMGTGVDPAFADVCEAGFNLFPSISGAICDNPNGRIWHFISHSTASTLFIDLFALSAYTTTAKVRRKFSPAIPRVSSILRYYLSIPETFWRRLAANNRFFQKDSVNKFRTSDFERCCLIPHFPRPLFRRRQNSTSQ